MTETSNQIETIGNLIELLQETPDALLGAMRFDPETLSLDLDQYALWKEKQYTRICLYRDSRVELILLCWSPGASTSVHCHAGSECWVHLCKGSLTESGYSLKGEKVTLVDTHTITKGDRAHINDEMGLHMLANTSGERAMSMHLYSPAVGACQTFDVLTQKSEWVTLKYDRVLAQEEIE